MDSIGLVALAIIVLVPAFFVAARIWQDPFAGLCLWVLLLPVSRAVSSLVGYPHDEGPELLQKLTLADSVLLVTGFAAVLNQNGPVGSLSAHGRAVVTLLFAFCAVAIVSAISGQAGPESFLELATYSWLCMSVVIICRLLAERRRADQVLSALKWAALVAVGAGGLGTVFLLGGSANNLLVRGGKVTGLFEAANHVQAFMITVIPFLCITTFSARASTASRLFHGGLILLGAVSVLASGSRAGIVLTLLSVWLMLLLTSPRACTIWTCVAVLAAGSAWGLFEEHRAEMPFAVQRALSFVDQDSFELADLSAGRANQFAAWQTVFVHHPVVGVGLDQLRYYVPRLVVGAKAQEAHNTYLAVLAETGVVGGLLIFTLLGVVLVRGLQFLRRALHVYGPEELGTARALLVAYVSLLLFESLHNGLRLRYFWFIVALIISLPRIYAMHRDR